MALLVPGLWFENSDLHSAQEYRLMLEALVGGRSGVWPSTSLVTETTGSERKVRVLGGRHYIWPRTQTHQGMGYAYNDGDVDLDIDAADPALPRIDLVIVEADDEETGGTVANTTQFRVVTGTPNASPSPPAVPDDAMALAEVEVAAAASVIVDADITDLPQLVTAVGGVRVCTSTTRPSSPYEGMRIVEVDTDRSLTYSGSKWVRSGWYSTTGRTGCKISRNAAQSIANNSGTYITFDAEDWDSDGFFAPSSTTVTVPADLDGEYGIAARVFLASTGTFSGALRIDIGGTNARNYAVGQYGGVADWSIGEPIPIVAGNTIKVLVLQVSGAAMNVTAQLEIVRIGGPC